MLRIGHKGADAIAPGQHARELRAAVEAGVDAIELDVLRPRADFAAGDDWRRAPGRPGRRARARCSSPTTGATPPRASRSPSSEALDAFARPPLDRVRFDLDLKVAGREDEVVAALARARPDRAGDGLDDGGREPRLPARAAPELDRGWTLPKVSRDWSRSRLAAPGVPRRLGLAARPAARRSSAAGRPSSASGRSGSITR